MLEKITRSLAVLALTGWAVTANATLLGDTISISSFANQGGTLVTVFPGVEYDFTHANGQRDIIDVSGSGFTVTLISPVVPWFYSGAGGADIVQLGGLDWVSDPLNGVMTDVQFVGSTISNGVSAFNLSFSDAPGLDSGAISFEMQGQSTNQTVSWSFDITATHVPEPATLALFSLGLAGLGFSRRRKA